MLWNNRPGLVLHELWLKSISRQCCMQQLHFSIKLHYQAAFNRTHSSYFYCWDFRFHFSAWSPDLHWLGWVACGQTLGDRPLSREPSPPLCSQHSNFSGCVYSLKFVFGRERDNTVVTECFDNADASACLFVCFFPPVCVRRWLNHASPPSPVSCVSTLPDMETLQLAVISCHL